MGLAIQTVVTEKLMAIEDFEWEKFVVRYCIEKLREAGADMSRLVITVEEWDAEKHCNCEKCREGANSPGVFDDQGLR